MKRWNMRVRRGGWMEDGLNGRGTVRRTQQCACACALPPHSHGALGSAGPSDITQELQSMFQVSYSCLPFLSFIPSFVFSFSLAGSILYLFWVKMMHANNFPCRPGALCRQRPLNHLPTWPIVSSTEASVIFHQRH